MKSHCTPLLTFLEKGRGKQIFGEEYDEQKVIEEQEERENEKERERLEKAFFTTTVVADKGPYSSWHLALSMAYWVHPGHFSTTQIVGYMHDSALMTMDPSCPMVDHQRANRHHVEITTRIQQWSPIIKI